MNLSGYSVKRPVTIVVLFALVIGISATIVPNLAVDLHPSVQRPVFSVRTSFPGAGPEDVERNVTEHLERVLSASSGLENMVSTSVFEFSFINLEFAYGTDMDRAIADAQILVNRIVNTLPDGVNAPTIHRFDANMVPIMRLVVRGNYPPDQLRVFAEDEIQAAIERIEGVAMAEVTGGARQIVLVEVSLNRLAAFNLTLNDISNALRGQSILASGGNLRMGTREFQIMTAEELVSLDQIRRLVVQTINNTHAVGNSQASRSQVIRLEDVADVRFGFNENATRIHVDQQTGVYIGVISESDSNSVRVSNNVTAALWEINNSLPPGITLEVLNDNTTMIRATMSQVYTNAYQGALLAMLVLLLFLRNFRGTFIIGLAIPVSIFITLMAMSVFGFTLNMLTMTGLIMGMGMTTDASIIILENVFKYRERGAKPDVAAILGSREVMKAIITATITTICVFIPLIIFRNRLREMGLLFSDLIFTVIISLSVSLLVAITLVPSLAGAILPIYTRMQKPLANPILRKIDSIMEGGLKAVERKYAVALDYCLSNRLIIVGLAFLILFFSVTQFSGVGMNMNVRTRVDDMITISVGMPRGTAIEVTERVVFDLQEIIMNEIEGFNNIILTARLGGNNQGFVQLTLPPPAEQIDTPDDIIRKLTPHINSFPGARIAFNVGRNIGGGGGGGGGGFGGPPIQIAVSSRDFNALMATAEEIQAILVRYMPEIEDPAINVDEGAPQLRVEIDRDRAAAFGLSMAAIANEIRTAMDGSNATTMSQGDRLLDVRVRLREEDRRGLPSLDSIFVMTRYGVQVPVSNVARVVEDRAPTAIRREMQQRVVRVTGGLEPGAAATEVQGRMEAVIAANLIPRDGVTIRYLGEAYEVQSYMRQYLFIIAVAIFLIFGVMASQFESFVDPLIIFFSIPLLFIGVVWMYRFTNQPMTMFAVVGIIACIGVVINAGIVLVDYTNTLLARGMRVREACIEAGKRRLRPILITSMSTIVCMVPIAFFPGVGAEMIQPIGKTFVGGLFVSTIMTLFVIPTMYSLLNSRRDRKLAVAVEDNESEAVEHAA
ncbi:MAG: efflux RND transporter permease subunit [Spirochaetes bacterium]|nr:efflux RND transporter permease subunit [Spirochaetota bacterium]